MMADAARHAARAGEASEVTGKREIEGEGRGGRGGTKATSCVV